MILNIENISYTAIAMISFLWGLMSWIFSPHKIKNERLKFREGKNSTVPTLYICPLTIYFCPLLCLEKSYSTNVKKEKKTQNKNRGPK